MHLLSTPYPDRVDALCYYLFDGQTVGKLLTGMKVYAIEAPKDSLSPSQCMYLALTEGLVNILLGLDWWWGVLDISGGKRCLHSVVSDTIVLNLEYEEKILK